MNNLEVEIAELQKMIEAKRDELEKSGGIIEEKDLVSRSVKEMFVNASSPKMGQTSPASAPNPIATTASASSQNASTDGSYLDYLDPETANAINQLIAEIPTKGITPVINQLGTQEPFVIDAFHDALVDKLYEELKVRGLVK